MVAITEDPRLGENTFYVEIDSLNLTITSNYKMEGNNPFNGTATITIK